MAQQISSASNNSIEVISPATLERLGEVPVDTPADVRVAAERARIAARRWAETPLARRAEVLLAARDIFLTHREELIELLCRENGKPRMEGLTELAYVGDMLTFYGKRARKFLDP